MSTMIQSAIAKLFTDLKFARIEEGERPLVGAPPKFRATASSIRLLETNDLKINADGSVVLDEDCGCEE